MFPEKVPPSLRRLRTINYPMNLKNTICNIPLHIFLGKGFFGGSLDGLKLKTFLTHTKKIYCTPQGSLRVY